MMGGDISNNTPPRVIVLVDAVVKSIEIVEDEAPVLKKLFAKSAPVKHVRWNAAALSHLWKVADNYGLSVELAGYEADGWAQSDLDKLMHKLDARGGNPFNYAQVYSDFHELVEELPYRGNLKAVIDIPSGVARYGSWGLEFQNL